MLMMSEGRRKARFVLFRSLEGDMKGRVPTTPSDFHILNRGRRPRDQKDRLELCLSALPSYTLAVICQFSLCDGVPGWVWIGLLRGGGAGRNRHRLGEPETGLGHLCRVASGCSADLGIRVCVLVCLPLSTDPGM